ncbi:DUF4359 domain-containing protein [Neobacillus cucumis]|uniref:DUF4359 domain-containing protein n=1 Tax=Neobacillus cucumis TaxID=1740721 RepID=A0A2N5HFN4_9BACI|nr:DUF4359 domain-containing protein [Neobacillus cucumis]PLS04317.1 hypothetical protein CVD27_11760 [Neobacillus cucumis]
MKRLVSLLLSVVIIFVLSATNPGRSEYVDWVNQKTMDQSSNLLKRGILSVAGKSIFDAGTTKKDYVVFSIYKTDFTDVGMGKMTTLGIFNQFIPLTNLEKEK